MFVGSGRLRRTTEERRRNEEWPLLAYIVLLHGFSSSCESCKEASSIMSSSLSSRFHSFEGVAASAISSFGFGFCSSRFFCFFEFFDHRLIRNLANNQISTVITTLIIPLITTFPQRIYCTAQSCLLSARRGKTTRRPEFRLHSYSALFLLYLCSAPFKLLPCSFPAPS